MTKWILSLHPANCDICHRRLPLYKHSEYWFRSAPDDMDSLDSVTCVFCVVRYTVTAHVLRALRYARNFFEFLPHILRSKSVGHTIALLRLVRYLSK